MSFLVIYVSNSESTSTSFSSQRDFIFVGTFQGQRLQFQNFTQGKKKQKRWKPHNAILVTSNAAPIATISNFLVSLAHTRAQVKHVTTAALTAWSHFHSAPDGCCAACAASHPLPGTGSRCLQKIKGSCLQQGVNNEIQEEWTRISFRQINGRIQAHRRVWNGR